MVGACASEGSRAGSYRPTKPSPLNGSHAYVGPNRVYCPLPDLVLSGQSTGGIMKKRRKVIAVLLATVVMVLSGQIALAGEGASVSVGPPGGTEPTEGHLFVVER